MSIRNKMYHYLILLNLIISICPKIIRHPNDIFGSHKTFIEAHRGVNKEIFQNTVPAISRAIDYDIESFETDVWLTKDNVLVIVHAGDDGNIEEYYDHPGNIMELTWDELSTFRTIEDNLPMPRLIDLLELTKNKLFMNLEIKDPRADLVFPYIMQLIEEYDFFDQVSLSSFHHDYYKNVVDYNNNHEKKIVFGFLYSKGESAKFDYTKTGHSLNIHVSDVTKEVCEKAHKNGMGVVTWFKFVDEESTEVYKQLILKGVDSICCNNPLLAKKFRDNYYSFS